MIRTFQELLVWNKAIELTEKIYLATKDLPPTEMYGLTSQMRGASVSVASNIAEDRSRGTRKDFAQFLRMARGSCAELLTQIIIAEKLFPTQRNLEGCKNLLTEIIKILNVMIKKLTVTS